MPFILRSSGSCSFFVAATTRKEWCSMRMLTGTVTAAIGGAAMLALSLGSASAFTLSGPTLEQPVASAQIEKVWCRWGRCGYGGWRGYGWHGGWGPGPGYYRHCWINRWGYRVCN
jgi:hypothetical protein